MKMLNFVKAIFFIALLPIIFENTVSAQDKQKEEVAYGWQKMMIGALNLTQSSFDNWVQGGENLFSWQLTLNFKFVNKQEKTNWANTGKLGFGLTRTGDKESRKSTDEIKLESVYTYKIGILINPYIAFNGETQFGAGYNYATNPKTQISDFMDPAYFRESIGIGFEPNDYLKTRLGFSFKQTNTNNYPAPYADNPETTSLIEQTRNEMGAESVTDLNWKISSNTLLISKLELFSTLKAFDEIDVNWDNTLTAKISKYFNMNLQFRLFYDKDISPKRQIKQALALGFSYSFM